MKIDSTCKSNEVSLKLQSLTLCNYFLFLKFLLMLLHTQVFNNPVFVLQYSQVVVEVRIYSGASGAFNFSLCSVYLSCQLFH